MIVIGLPVKIGKIQVLRTITSASLKGRFTLLMELRIPS